MATINSYLTFDGNAEEAFDFYKSVFGGDFTTKQRFKEVPGMDNLSDDDGEKMMHIALPIGKGNTLMASDSVPSMGHPLVIGNNFSLSIEAGSKEEAVELFNALAAGGKTTMELQDTFWGAHFGMLLDKFGIQWMVNYTYPQS